DGGTTMASLSTRLTRRRFGCSAGLGTSPTTRSGQQWLPACDSPSDSTDHRTTQVRSPRTNGFVERMNRTLLDEGFRVAARTTSSTTPEEIQRDLDRFVEYYTLQRSHQGYRLQGRPPAQAQREALGVEDLPAFIPPLCGWRKSEVTELTWDRV